MIRVYKICFQCILLLSALSVDAQERVTLSYDSILFDELVKEIQAKTTYRFYYDVRTTDSLKVSITVTDKELPFVLEQVLTGTDLHFAIDRSKRVIITEGREIMTKIPDSVLGKNKPQNNIPVIAFDYSAYEKLQKQKKLVESRLYSIGAKTSDLQGNGRLAGSITESGSGEPVIGAAVYVENPMIGTVTDQFGFYSLTLPRGRHELKIKSLGMKTTSRKVLMYGDGRLNIELDNDIIPLKEVVIESKTDLPVSRVQMGVERLDIKTMKNMPLMLGETDIMKVVLTLPGVQTVGEGTVGLNVRGGATNQNLILFNDAVVYNPSHFFGFFSTFNPDVLKNVELYKSGITAGYGGRLSSVLDVSSREGNVKKISGSGGISPITGRISLEGPIIKDKTSFLFGARSTYSNWILHKISDADLKKSRGSFYDLSLNITHKFNDKNSLYLSGYLSQDKFRLASDTTYRYSDRNTSIKWKHLFNNKLYAVVTGTMSRYDYAVQSISNPVTAFDMSFKVQQETAKIDFNYFLNAKHTVTAGLSNTWYKLAPGTYHPFGKESLITPIDLQREQGRESAVYMGDNFDITSRFSLYAGIRYSYYQAFGPKSVYVYPEGISKSNTVILDTLQYNARKSIATYHGAEPRVSIRYSISDKSSIKLSYNRMRQYIQMLSNTTAITPTDIWKLSDGYIKPQTGDQYSAGFYQTLRKGTVDVSVEGYYKTMQNTIDYKNGAKLLLNDHIETDVVNTIGKAYGAEFMVRKASGKLNGWISYTYSRTFLQTTSTHESEIVNRGEWYRSSYDKPHAVNLVGNYKFSRRVNFSLNTTYSTGRPITIPVGTFDVDGIQRPFYSERNQYRIPDYFRIDISINVEGNHKVRKLAHSSWTFAVYNLTGRDNAYSVFFRAENKKITAYKLSVFAQPIPTLTYNFRF